MVSRIRAGAEIEVFSRNANAWLPGYVKSVEANGVTVEYENEGDVYQKLVAHESASSMLRAAFVEDSPRSGYEDSAASPRAARGNACQEMAANSCEPADSEEEIAPGASAPQAETKRPLKSCIAGGKYVPGTEGNTGIRNAKTAKLGRTNPSIMVRIQDNEAAEVWNSKRVLSFDDKLTDGFTARFAKELISVDKNADSKLREFLAFCRGAITLRTEPSPHKEAQMISEFVCDALGGTVDGEKGANAGANLIDRLDRLVMNSGKSPTELMPIGDTFCGGEIFGLEHVPGAGICRHRAMLFKYVCDELEICDCALVDGMMPPTFALTGDAPVTVRDYGNFDHMWNVVRIEGQNYVVDPLNWPGQLIDSKGLEDLPVQFCRIGGRAGLSLWEGNDESPQQHSSPSGLFSKIKKKVGWNSK